MGRNDSKNLNTANQYCCLIASDFLSSADKFSAWCCHHAPSDSPTEKDETSKGQYDSLGVFHMCISLVVMWKETEPGFESRLAFLNLPCTCAMNSCCQSSFYTLFLNSEVYKVSNALKMHVGMYIYSEDQKSMT